MRRLTPVATIVLTALFVTALTSPVQAAWAGTNGRIAFCDFSSGDCMVSTMNADGSGEQQITGGFTPNWSPDGRRIAFADAPGRKVELFTINPDGSDRQQVTHLGGFNGDPSWSPNGSLLVFEHQPVVGCCVNIWTIRANGSAPHQVTNFTTEVFAQEPEFSPDGQSIAFWEFNAGGGDFAAIFVMRADGTDIGQVTPTALDADHPEWSPDGSRLIFNNDAHLNVGDIFTIRPNGTGLKQLTNVIPLGEADFRPAYSPDSSMIVFTQLVDGQPDAVLTMKANGSSPRVINSTGFAPDWGRLAP